MRELITIFVCLEMDLLMAKPNPTQFWFLCASLKERKKKKKKMGPGGNGNAFSQKEALSSLFQRACDRSPRAQRKEWGGKALLSFLLSIQLCLVALIRKHLFANSQQMVLFSFVLNEEPPGLVWFKRSSIKRVQHLFSAYQPFIALSKYQFQLL